MEITIWRQVLLICAAAAVLLGELVLDVVARDTVHPASIHDHLDAAHQELLEQCLAQKKGPDVEP